jgi:hypothetical protein
MGLKIIRKNIFWPIFFYFSVVLFLLINLIAVHFSWTQRQLPPEPDDTGVYSIYLRGNSKYSSIFSTDVKALNRVFMWGDGYGGQDRAAFFSWAP